MSLYEVPRLLFGFGMYIMLASFLIYGMMLVLRATA